MDTNQIQAHYREVRSILAEHGCLDKAGRIRHWDGNVWDVLAREGHSKLDHTQCNCCKDIPSGNS